MPFRTRLTEMFGIEHPVLLAPMGGVSGGQLAAAVSNAGGLGLIGVGYEDTAWIEQEFSAAGNARVGAGFITWHLAQKPERLEVVLAHRPAAVMLSFGDLSPFAPAIRAAGAKLVVQVQSLADACRAAELGADLIVAQGAEAGGHGATRATLPLVPAVVDAVAPLPVAAAGGIADGRDLAAALMLGAAGVLVGTRFYAAAEALAHRNAQAGLVAGRGDDTVRTTVFDRVRALDWPAPYTGRALRNDLTARWHGREAGLDTCLDAERRHYREAAARGDFDTAVLWASEAVDLIEEVSPAAEIIGRMVAEAEATLARGQALLRG